MKKTVLTFGLIAGVIISILMFSTLPFHDQIGFDKGLYVGYTTMLASFLMVFFGIRSYRENIGGGKISFGRAFSVGILITLIVCLFYVITWEIIYAKFIPDVMDKYANYTMEKMRASGATQQAIDASMKEMQDFKVSYAKPLIRVAFTLVEIFPVGLLVTLVSALVLRKK